MDRRRPGSRVEDSTFVAIDHVDGVRSRLWASLIAARTGPRFRVRGLGGEFVKEDVDPQEDQLLAGMRPNDPGFGEDPPERWGRIYASDGSVTPDPDGPGRLPPVLRRRSGTPFGASASAPVDPLDSVRGLRVLEAAEELRPDRRGRHRVRGVTMARRRLRLGFQVWSQYVTWPELMAMGHEIDELGFDELWSNDHFLPQAAGGGGELGSSTVRCSRGGRCCSAGRA